MTKKELIEKMKDLPDNSPVILADNTTDDPMSCFYSEIEGFVEEYYEGDIEDPNNKPSGKALFLSFDNKLNENPI